MRSRSMGGPVGTRKSSLVEALLLQRRFIPRQSSGKRVPGPVTIKYSSLPGPAGSKSSTSSDVPRNRPRTIQPAPGGWIDHCIW